MEEKVEKQPQESSGNRSFFAGVPKKSPHPFSDEGFLFISSTKYLCHFSCAISHKWQR
ncbi:MULTISPECIES: hypothetical protein [unclassified Bacillus (in: firmicutes)]|uniref:hypothetical protein n=1 Tax=unclassified Bacillus (in: firmicutes) TaxID=185979 RepID=UPI001BE555E4|nr:MULTISPECIES: hypothetical protein [unclassified Bacillus (in: firmicutes)]MBT2615057.1 hypothetical protein [Bacillus sp. ISL-78]MBT2627674.1 hypothetical protein [Bacillus sp. ISL-101]